MRLPLMLSLALVLTALIASPASAAITVNTTADAAAGGGCAGDPGDCSIRQALGVASDGETVVVPSGTYPLSLGSLQVALGVTIRGAGARTTTVSVADGSAPHVFDVSSASEVALSGMTISAGHVVGTGVSFLHGGAIYNRTGSVLTLDGVAVSGTTLEKTDTSSGAVRGAGIANNGTLSISNSTVSGNVQRARGNESGNQGAGLFNSGGSISIVNSTIAGNSQIATEGAASEGAAIDNLGSEMTLLNVTVTANSGSAAISNNATIDIRNSIVSNGPSGNCDSTLTSKGHNIEAGASCGFGAVGDQTGVDPLLGPFGANGGPTDTAPLLAGSPAIDRGDPAHCPATDQRGVARPQGPICDVGAFEFVAAQPGAIPSNAFRFGRLKRNRRTGTAKLTVDLPGPGTIALSGKGVSAGRSARRAKAPLVKPVGAAGPVTLPIRSTGKALRRLNRTGSVKLRVSVAYTPAGGIVNERQRTIRLIKKR